MPFAKKRQIATIATAEWLGDRRGNLIDWFTQQWVLATGRRVDLAAEPRLVGPVGSTRGIGLDYFDKWGGGRGPGGQALG